MALLDATNAEIAFTPMAAFGSLVEADTTIYSWLTPNPAHQIRALGTGFTYSGNTPTGGTVTSITFDLIDNTHPYGFTDVTITGISVPLADLVNLSDPAAGEVRFWDVILSGNDTIRAPLAAGGKFFGDFLSVQATVAPVARTGGDDIFYAENTSLIRTTLSRGGEGSPHALIGDAATVNGTLSGAFIWNATVTGGADEFFVSKKAGFTVIGDVQVAGTYAIVNGGDDTVTSTINIISATEGNRFGLYVGDVEVNLGLVNGGRDTIRGSNFAFANEYIIGDVLENGDVGAPATLNGGRDVLLGRAGQDIIAGDVFRMQAGTMTGGNDRIEGGQDSDIISGDVFQSIGLQFIVPIGGGTGSQITTTITMTGGNDRLLGDEGNDWIVGDLWNGDGIAEPSMIAGGNDTIFGGAGDDMLYGDIGADYIALLDSGGDDVLDGGLGNDIIDGQLGRDTASFASVDAAVIVDLSAGTATGQGNDLLLGIENITGSSRGDTLRGDGSSNVIDGGAGNDAIQGRGGNDRLSGGTGRDTVNGAGGNDVLVAAADAAGDTFIGGAGADALDLSAATSNTFVTFSGAEGSGTVSGGGFGADTFSGIEVVIGSNASGLVDTVMGGTGSQLFWLQNGNDIAFGGGGADAIAGQGGSDRIDGGFGNDILNGGNGGDTFVFSTALNAANNVDIIEDFNTSADLIELAATIFSSLAAGNLAAAAFFKGSGATAAQDANDRIIYDTATGGLYYDSDGINGAAAIKFATLDNIPLNLNAGDFLIA